MPELREDNKGYVIFSRKTRRIWKSDGASRHVANLYLARSGAENAMRQIYAYAVDDYEIREVDLSFLLEGETDDSVE